MGMQIDKTTTLKDATGSTCELDYQDGAGVTSRTKNGKPFTLESAEDVAAVREILEELETRFPEVTSTS